MKTMKLILRFSLILYLCLFLTGAAYILTASAKITPKPEMEGTTLITIVKGDTLWGLAAKHLEDPLKWPDFNMYNDFTNPDRIYPDEMMRVPAKMVMEMVEEAVEEETVGLSELEALKEEMAAMEAKMMAAKEATGVTAGDVAAIKKMVEDLIAQHQMVESGLQSVKDKVDEVTAEIPSAVDKINASLMEHSEASKTAISKVRKQVKSLREDVEKLREMGKKQQKKGMEALKATEEMLAGGIKKNAKGIDKLIAIEKGASEKPNKSKRTLAFLTTLAGGTAWFVISAIGSD